MDSTGLSFEGGLLYVYHGYYVNMQSAMPIQYSSRLDVFQWAYRQDLSESRLSLNFGALSSECHHTMF